MQDPTVRTSSRHVQNRNHRLGEYPGEIIHDNAPGASSASKLGSQRIRQGGEDPLSSPVLAIWAEFHITQLASCCCLGPLGLGHPLSELPGPANRKVKARGAPSVVSGRLLQCFALNLATRAGRWGRFSQLASICTAQHSTSSARHCGAAYAKLRSLRHSVSRQLCRERMTINQTFGTRGRSFRGAAITCRTLPFLFQRNPIRWTTSSVRTRGVVSDPDIDKRRQPRPGPRPELTQRTTELRLYLPNLGGVQPSCRPLHHHHQPALSSFPRPGSVQRLGLDSFLSSESSQERVLDAVRFFFLNFFLSSNVFSFRRQGEEGPLQSDPLWGAWGALLLFEIFGTWAKQAGRVGPIKVVQCLPFPLLLGPKFPASTIQALPTPSSHRTAAVPLNSFVRKWSDLGGSYALTCYSCLVWHRCR